MKSFLEIVSGLVFGVLSRYDRLMFRGLLRELGYTGGAAKYCACNRILYRRFQAARGTANGTPDRRVAIGGPGTKIAAPWEQMEG
jgi:hypothetical protein